MTADRPDRRRWTEPPYSFIRTASGELEGQSVMPGITDEDIETIEARNAAFRHYAETNEESELWRLGALPEQRGDAARPEQDDSPEAWREWGRYLDLKYGITLKQWNALLESQGYVCGVCRTPEPGQKWWHTDHDPATERVRGILCGQCNMQLVAVMDRLSRDPELADRLKAYVAADGLDPEALARQAEREEGHTRLLNRLGLRPMGETPPE